MTKKKEYVSLHNHTTYSMMSSVIRPAELFTQVKALGQPAVAVTDYGTMAGAWDCLKASKKTGVKLLMGCNFNFVDDLKDPGKSRHIILIAKNYEGYKNLLKASKMANDNYVVAYRKVVPRIDWDILSSCSEGLICTTADGGGILGQLINTRKVKEAREQAQKLKNIFGDSLAFEIQPHAMYRNASPYNDYEDQRLVNNMLIKIGDELGVKVVPATGAHYLTKDQWKMHDALLSIGSGIPARARARLKFNVNDFYVKSREEVEHFLRRYYKDRAEEFCDNTLLFADMCENPVWIDPKYSNPSGKELPEFPVHDQDDYVQFRNWFNAESSNPNSDIKPEMPEDVAYLRYWCLKEFKKKVPAGQEEKYMQALNEEFDVLEYHGFSSYMLIVADYIQFCKNNLIPVGPGRGSVGGSLVAFLIGIHQADPIKYDLIFARFHNKSKTSFPDIDTDFAPSGRAKVQQYIIDKYGEDKVAHVSNLNTMTPKVYARDIARAFEYGGNRTAAAEIGTNIADSIPSEIKSVHSALEKAPLFAEYAKNDRYSELKRFADLGGIERAWSTHAGGLVISKRPLSEFVPVRRDKEGNIAIEYEKNRAEENGLVKMDTLGLETLDIIRNTYLLIDMNGKELPPIVPDYDEYDKATYDLISRGDTMCVFQLGTSAGTIDLCKRVKPKCIEDISIINSLARPSARDIRQKFIATKDGEKEVEILHPALNRAFKPTYGFGLYEECLMYLAQDVAGWSLHEADGLRKLTKEKGKNPKKAAKLKQDFIDGSIIIVGKSMGEKIWDEVVDKFQGYGFNHSHSILYSFISYHTAYLKAHFPLEFMVANLMSEVNSNAKIAGDNINKIKNEIRRKGVKIFPPNINSSDKTYKIVDNGTLLTGLSSLKYMGKDAIPEILKHRPFKSFDDFLSRVDGRKVRVTAIYAMAASGCLDDFGLTRKQMYLYASDYKKKLQTWKKKNTEDPFVYPWPEDIGEWTLAERYAMENYYLGEGLCCGIKEAYPGFFNGMALDFSTVPDIFPESEAGPREKYFIPANVGVVQGVIKSIFEFKVKKETSKIFGQTMAKVELEDPFGHTIGMTIFPGGLDLFRERLRVLTRGKAEFDTGIAVHCAASINWYEGEASLIFEDLRNAAPIPPRPKDLKPRKVSMRIARKKKTKKVSKIDPNLFLEEVEDELIEEGHSDIDYI